MSVDEGPTLDLRRLRLLRELERHGTVTATAAALHVTPSAVSQQVAGLARELGVPLLEKVGRGVRLTGQARVLLGHADAVATQLELARADLVAWSGGVLGEVRVGALATAIAALVAPAVAHLRRERPRLRLRVEERDHDVVALLDAGEIDVAVSVDHAGAPRRDDPRYHRVDLLTDVLDALLPADHPLAALDEVPLAELAGEPWVGAAATDVCMQVLQGACASAGFSPDVRHVCREWDAVASLVAAGAGVGVVPRLAQPLRPEGLVVRPLLGSPAARLIFGVTRAGRSADVATAAALDALCAVAGARPDAVPA